MGTEFNSIDDFLGHKTNEGSGGNFLKNWKKNGFINVWFHTKRLPLGLWQHNFPKRVVFEDKDTGESTVAFWGNSYNCWENESVLTRQYMKTADGTREVPPERCPLCKLIDHVRMSVNRGELSWTDPIFVFKGATDPSKNMTIHAGGIFGAFGRDLTGEQEAELGRKGIVLGGKNGAWRENGMPKCQYVFCIVDNDNPGEGIQIATEPKSLGDKVKAVINDKMVGSKNPSDGNPMVNPYCIQLTKSQEKGVAWDKMYHARAVAKFELTPEIEKHIRSDAPDLTKVVAPFDANNFRSIVEKYAVVDFPWDEIFGATGAVSSETDLQMEDEAATRKKSSPRTVIKAEAPPPPPAAKASDDVEMIPCDNCGHQMREDEEKCAKCGTVYSFEDEAEPPPPPPPPPSSPRRSVANKPRPAGETGDKMPF